MFTEMALIPRSAARVLRRATVILVLVAMASLGAVALASTASAGEDRSSSAVERSRGNGPDTFLEFEHGKKPVFFCEDGKGKMKKRHRICTDLTATTRF